ncbi:hypothetical protein AV274_3163 [Blastocystis sp. ATCC 50177/Nand II]|nr:hypothetical protein AV274_4071 [Blastocystis sp. ATCC 50177/Nand II]OAO15127.1 hypothetical protein AV274_3163 [Blastocystis sp. ATCC 50177/Nand II]
MPNELAGVNLKHPQFTGFLTKRSAWLKDWRKRYFILKGNKLYFCKSVDADPHGVIDLSKCQTIKSADDVTHKKHSLEIVTTDSTYYMYADTEKEKDDWIGAIGRAIVHSSLRDSDSD